MDINELLTTFQTNIIGYAIDLLVAIIIFAATLLLAPPLGRWVERNAERRIQNRETLRLLGRLTRWGVYILGTVAALGQARFDVTGFVAALGIAGFTVGFALQDIARNFVAGILLLIRQPFKIGDTVKITEFTGSVLDITTRDTVIKTLDGEMVILPNLDVFTSPITNFSELPLRRRTIMIGLGYEEDVTRAEKIMLDTIRKVDGVQEDPPATLRVEGLGDSSLTLAARFWVDQRTHDLFVVHSAVVQAIKEVTEAEGISLPYPIQTIRLEHLTNQPSAAT